MLVVRMTQKEWQKLKACADNEDCEAGSSGKQTAKKIVQG